MRRRWQTLAAGALVMMLAVPEIISAQNADLVAWFKAYDAAYAAKDLDKLSTMHHKDVTVFEGTAVNNGWTDYRTNHLGAEFPNEQDLQFSNSNVVVHSLGDSAAYVTTDYAKKYKTAERVVESGGVMTYVMVKDAGAWKIRHIHIAIRRRPAGGMQ